ncbi:hypothetical protein RUM44_001422 [Polyplax serrata]|uniref:Uncharacterized protein n=1 Tax=Polyplax serrata TaxID=468196 RepID=A0ABR1AK15_POLSC
MQAENVESNPKPGDLENRASRKERRKETIEPSTTGNAQMRQRNTRNRHRLLEVKTYRLKILIKRRFQGRKLGRFRWKGSRRSSGRPYVDFSVIDSTRHSGTGRKSLERPNERKSRRRKVVNRIVKGKFQN